MASERILEKAIKKAIDGGWRHECMEWYDELDNETAIKYLISLPSVVDIIFNKEFAKALWGTPTEYTLQELRNGGITAIGMKIYRNGGWMHHLQEMVIADDPIEYLGRHLDD